MAESFEEMVTRYTEVANAVKFDEQAEEVMANLRSALAGKVKNDE